MPPRQRMYVSKSANRAYVRCDPTARNGIGIECYRSSVQIFESLL